MQVYARGINQAFREMVGSFHFRSTEGDVAEYDLPIVSSLSRDGPVLRVDEPVTFRFSHPAERVLFNAARDINIFSVLYESLWTLAGRNDVQSIAYYTPGMTKYSDDGATWHGAYGHRWRHDPVPEVVGKVVYRDGGPDDIDTLDQLDQAVFLLREDNGTRRVVLTMWDAAKDLHGQQPNGKDYPCNTHVYVKVRHGKLDIHVCNRSNDLVLGLFGTNFVVFSFLAEYLAAKVGVPIGRYYHTTDDLHVYLERHGAKLGEWLAEHSGHHDQYRMWCRGVLDDVPMVTVPLVKGPVAFDREVQDIVERYCGRSDGDNNPYKYTEPFLQDVAQPMFLAFRAHKEKHRELALEFAGLIQADDWRIAASAWLTRRYKEKT